MHYDTLKSLIGNAINSGATRARGVSFFTYEWDIAGRCESPTPVEIYRAPSPDHGEKYIRVAPGTEKPMRIIMHARCRKCPRCLRQRAQLWRYRAQNETALAARTWFGTLTIRPDVSHRALMEARSRLSDQGVDLDALSADDRFIELHKSTGKSLTRWLKRLRKNSGAKLRYLVVAEAHKSGLPHYHCLIHEVRPDQPIGERELRKAWTWGFSKFNLVNSKNQATYLCKYLSKDARARVRASGSYGQPPMPSSGHSELVNVKPLTQQPATSEDMP